MLDIVKDNDKVIEYIKNYKTLNNITIRNKLIEECWECLRKYGKYFFGQYRFFPLEEYEIFMVEAFIHCVERYDFTKENMFRTYFHHRAKGTVLDEIRKIIKKNKNVYISSLDAPIKNKDGKTFNAHEIVGDVKYNIEKEYIYYEHIKDVEQSEKTLYNAIYEKLKPGLSKDVFYCFYILGMDKDKIAQKFNITRNRVSRCLHYPRKLYMPSRINSIRLKKNKAKANYKNLLKYTKNKNEKELLKLYYIENNSMSQATSKINITLQQGYYYLKLIHKRYEAEK